MAQLLLKRTSQKLSMTEWKVMTYTHDTVLSADFEETEFLGGPGQVYNPAAGLKVGQYCSGTTLNEVFVADARDGTSRIATTANSSACVVIPPADNGGSGSGTGSTGEPENDPAAPAGAKLLYRTRKPVFGGGFTYIDTYWNPATRLRVVLDGGPVDDIATYSRPLDQIVDRWCLETGVAPFAEERVFHNGSGTVRFATVNDVSTCYAPPCTLALPAPSPALVTNDSGRVDAELVATGANGPIQYFIGSPLNPGQATGKFPALPQGRYTVFVEETRVNGCKASVSFAVTSPYALRYRVSYCNKAGQPCQVRFSRRGYTGPVEDIMALADPVTIEWPEDSTSPDHPYGGVLRGSSLDCRLLLGAGNDLRDLYSADERYIKVEHTVAGVVQWRGWLLPEQYDIAFLPPKNEFNLRASDALGTLGGMPFTDAAGNLLTGQWNLIQVIQHCLSRTGILLPLYVRDLLYPLGASETLSPLEQVTVDISAFRTEKDVPFSCEKVLRDILEGRGGRLWQDVEVGVWRWERLSDLRVEATAYRAYAVDGTALPAPSLYSGWQRLRPNSDLYWVTAAQRQLYRPAVSKVVVKADPGDFVNLLARPARWAEEDFGADGRPVRWTGTAPVRRVIPASKNDLPALLIQGTAPGSNAAPLYIQTPPTIPVTGVALVAPLQLSFTATLRSAQPIDPATTVSNLPKFYVAVRHGGEWLGAGGASSTTQVLYYSVDLEEVDKPRFTQLGGFGRSTPLPAPVEIRFLQMVTPGTRARYDLEIKDLRLTYGLIGSETYNSEVIAETDSFFTRADDGLSVRITDTPENRLAGTMIGPTYQPTTTWYEQGTIAQQRPLLAFLVRDRLIWQGQPLRRLTGILKGDLSVGSLLTDYSEEFPAVYVVTSARQSAEKRWWTIAATELLTLTAPELPEPWPANVLLCEDGRTPLLAENGEYLFQEDAN